MAAKFCFGAEKRSNSLGDEFLTHNQNQPFFPLLWDHNVVVSPFLPHCTSTTLLKASRQKHRSWQLYCIEKNGLQQIQRKAANQSKDWGIRRRLRDKKKKKKNQNQCGLFSYESSDDITVFSDPRSLIAGLCVSDWTYDGVSTSKSIQWKILVQ
jgi:hypothetical protein